MSTARLLLLPAEVSCACVLGAATHSSVPSKAVRHAQAMAAVMGLPFGRWDVCAVNMALSQRAFCAVEVRSHVKTLAVAVVLAVVNPKGSVVLCERFEVLFISCLTLRVGRHARS